MKSDIDKLLLDKNEKSYEEKMCSFPDASLANMYSPAEDSACGSRMLSASGEHVEIPYRT